MADNLGNNNNIFVDFDCQNIVLVDPNKTQNYDGKVSERKLEHENLVMYANLEARVLPRTKLAVGAPLDDAIQSVNIASMNFLRPGGRTQLRNDYIDQITGLKTQNQFGTTQPNTSRLKQDNKTDEFYISQNTDTTLDTGLLGIESIRIKNTRSATPTVDMVLIDTQGRALFEKGENSEYAAFFNLPYPIFYLTLKGFYGKAIKYQLVMTNFSAAFEGNTGNYRISLKFYSYKYTILAETQVASLYALPYMYGSDYRIQVTGQEPPAVQAARASLGNNLTSTISVRETKGMSNIKNMYKKYKGLGLIDPNLPELSIPELMARLELLEKNILEGFGQTDFTPLSDIQNYTKLIADFYNDVYSNNESSWFTRYIQREKPFVLLGEKSDTSVDSEPETIIVYLYKNNIASSQDKLDAYLKLDQIVTSYKNALSKNPTLGLNGSVTIDKTKDSTTGIDTLQKIQVVNPSKSVNSQNLLIEDTFRKSITPQQIDWDKTFELVSKRKPNNPEEVQKFRSENIQFFQPTAKKVGSEIATYPTYNFIFNGQNNFEGIINQIEGQITKQKEKVVLALTVFLQKKIEGPNGLGFKPSMRNIMAMIFASIEGMFLLLDDVHEDAWKQRLNPKRKRAIFTNNLKSASTETKDLSPNENQQSLTNIPVYPWPQYLVNTNKDNDEPFELRYPGDKSEITRTGANDFESWPEVEFVEEYIKGLSKTADSPSTPNGNSNLSRTILRLSLNAIEFPMTNIPYSDYQVVKFLYEIYERVLLTSYWDRFSKNGSPNNQINQTFSDIESLNIQTSLLGASPSLTKILKNIAFTSTNYLDVLRTASNDGTGPSWQQLIRGEFTSDYLRSITSKDFSILPNSVISNSSESTEQKVESLDKVVQFVKDTGSNQKDFTDLYPFVYTPWNSENLGAFTSQGEPFETTKSLFVNETKKFVTNYQVSSTQNDNRPFTSGDFLSVQSPQIDETNGLQKSFDQFYSERTLSGNLLVTEGPITYSNKTGNVIAEQTTSILNTPFFVNALNEAVESDRVGTDLNPYVKPAYIFLNSLPLVTLRERYKNLTPDRTEQLDFVFATLTKFGGVHKLPYAWILKYGSIWHRYKKYIDTDVDILSSVWNNVDYFNLYDPNNQNLQEVYSFTNQKSENVEIVGQSNVTAFGGTFSIMNVGFYPKMINNMYYLMTGQDLFSTYSNSEFQTAVNEGLNVGNIQPSSIKTSIGFDPQQPNRLLNLTTWYTSFDTKNSAKFNPNQQNQTLVIPSFGSNVNQVRSECFVEGATGLTLTQEVFNNRAVFDGSVRSFWQAPNYGYFELPSITQPRYDQYIKEVRPQTENRQGFELGEVYSTIEELFGVFKTEILDEFEQEFLKFSISAKNVEVTEISSDNLVNKNFQSLIQELMTVDRVDNTLPYADYVKLVGEAQAIKVTNTLQTFMNFDVVFRYGNPSNFNRRLFGSFTTLPSNQVFDGFTYNPYALNSLPTNGGIITLQVSQGLFPEAWNNMYKYVGFATTNGLQYSDQGSYYTDFFVDMNIEFTPQNVINFAPLIKIYGTQKLLVDGNYGKTQFTEQINKYYTDGDLFISQILTLLFSSLQKQLPNVEQTNEKPIISALDSNFQKLDFWETFKAFNDKWIAGGEFKTRTLFQDVLFLDRANRDIGDLVLMDVMKLKNFLSSTRNSNARIIDFISKMFADNQFQMMPMPAYVNFWGVGDVTNNQRPRTETSQDLANSLFGTYLEVDYRESSPKLVCYFVGKPSEHLALPENPDYRFKSDSFIFNCEGDIPVLDKIEGKTNFGSSNKVVGFNVDFGTRNQGVFYSIQLDQNQAAATAESNRVVTDITLQAGGRRASSQSVSLFNYYKTRTYECRVESLGNAMIQPTMYFNLQHVPMFQGPYMIQSVEHVIEGGDFKTFFTGLRMPVAQVQKITDQILSLNINFLSELVQDVQRLKETDARQVTNNVISVGNSIQTNQVYTPADPVRCVSDIQTANVNYRNYSGVETVKTEITFADLAKKLKTKVNDPILRVLVFFTAYTNGHDNNKFINYDNDLGGTPLGGTVYQNINYAGRKKFFTPTYGCRTNSSGVSVPYAVFTNYENSIDFISDWYKGWYKSDKDFKWSTKNDFIDTLYLVWAQYWPTKKFQNKEQYANWVLANTDTITTLRRESSEVVEKCISLGLITF
jgi:hypothetical protein